MKFVAVLGLVVLFGAPLVESLSTLNDYIGSFTFYVDDNSQSQRNSFINNIGQRGMEHIAFYDKFRTRIIKRLQEIPGTNGLEIGKGFEKIVKKLKADLSYNITSNKYWDLADTCYFDIKDKLEVFTNTSDTSKQDSCWSTRRFTMYGILGKLGNDLTGILNTWLLDFHNPLTEFEAKMFADLVTLEGDFKKCNYKWKCIREYVKF